MIDGSLESLALPSYFVFILFVVGIIFSKTV